MKQQPIFCLLACSLFCLPLLSVCVSIRWKENKKERKKKRKTSIPVMSKERKRSVSRTLCLFFSVAIPFFFVFFFLFLSLFRLPKWQSISVFFLLCLSILISLSLLFSLFPIVVPNSLSLSVVDSYFCLSFCISLSLPFLSLLSSVRSNRLWRRKKVRGGESHSCLSSSSSSSSSFRQFCS